NGRAGVGSILVYRRSLSEWCWWRTAQMTGAHDDEHLTPVMRRHPDPLPVVQRVARAALIAFSVSGAISLAYEVVWSRILAVLFDSSIYGFVLMLATVLAGIALGGALGGLLVRSAPSARLAAISFGCLELGIGLAAVLALAAL